MIAFVDPDLCIGCTQCAGLCPAVFRMEGVLAVAEPGALGTADAQLRVYECVHANTSLRKEHCPFCRKLCLCKRFAVWYNKTAGNRQEEIR